MTTSPGTISYQEVYGGKFRIFPAGYPCIVGTYRHTKPAVLLWRVCPGTLGSRCDRNIEMQTCFVRLCVERSECISSNLTCFHRDHQCSKVTVLREISVKQEKLQVLLTKSQKSIDRRYSNNTPLGGTRLRIGPGSSPGRRHCVVFLGRKSTPGWFMLLKPEKSAARLTAHLDRIET